MSIQLRDGLADQPLDRVLEDLLVRFVVNVPQEDLSSIERIFFQVEEAQWFYSDFIRQMNPSLPAMKMKLFSGHILEKCPLIWKWGDPENALSRFGKYKSTIPVRGVALLNHDLTKVVLVKGTESNAWSFPRGKISKGESDIECAIREVEEETGFNCRDLINENDFIERTIRGKNYKIYLVKNVDESTNFSPATRFEISKIQWHDIKSLQKNCNKNPNNYFIVGTVFKPMLRWINKNKTDVTEEELMMKAEIKLKRLLGLDKDIDAGRKLMDMVKASSTTATAANSISTNNVSTPQPVVPVPIHQQVPMFGPPIPPPFPIYNSIPLPSPYPMGMTPVPPHQLPPPTQERNYLTPNPQTLVKPTIKSGSANSKELLSLLTKKADKVQIKPEDEPKSNPTENENVKQALLDVLHKEPKSFLNIQPKPSNEIEESLQKKPTQPGKITLLKRDGTHSKNKKSMELMSMLGGKPKNETQPPEPVTSPGKELLSILNKSKSPEQAPAGHVKPSAGAELLGLLNKSKTPEHPPSNQVIKPSAGAELLGLLNKKSPTEPQSLDLSNQAQPRKSVTSPGAELLGILNKNKSPISPTLEQTLDFSNQAELAQLTKQATRTSNFEDFEDFEDGYDFDPDHHQPGGFRNFDIASDEEDVDHLIDPITTESHGFFPSPKAPTKIRILKREDPAPAGFSLNGAKPDSSAGTNAEGQGLLALLKGGKQEHPNPAPISLSTTQIKSDAHKRSADFLKDLLKR
ncbi:uncharacterized protein SPAPADRAFT_49006 [Spathaspora passalidarum NRRL Y-27907]|uniref:Nudix hydrolase domain-containing protein n=1 Tax=Spathaspora passalidarum (strain NRRL Y-27907 / 11-Y1) TaxID=619300 RepID=G3AJK7_SPAPN|nr:uncharacterized protein SPAPADRAFT_49006 [Spathaspora passalidarum NRRL Y-27907]EGW33910.1 hypothetical protein SPAPADRAFT_49006 [Spathaspora passalidarum NRRL Y-27907]